MRTVAIIQARMASTRLPQKAMLDIAGHTMLWHVVQRLHDCQNLDEVVVATTVNTEDQAITDFCRAQGFHCYRGSSEDVLDRYFQAAKAYKAEAVVRITSDCPLIDPEIVDELIKRYSDSPDEYAGASTIIRRSYPRGLDCELVSMSTLTNLWERVTEPKYREHVTLYIYDHLHDFRMISLEFPEDLSRYRWTVDEQADLDFVREVYRQLYAVDPAFRTRDVLKLLNKDKKLQLINQHIEQKTYT